MKEGFPVKLPPPLGCTVQVTPRKAPGSHASRTVEDIWRVVQYCAGQEGKKRYRMCSKCTNEEVRIEAVRNAKVVTCSLQPSLEEADGVLPPDGAPRRRQRRKLRKKRSSGWKGAWHQKDRLRQEGTSGDWALSFPSETQVAVVGSSSRRTSGTQRITFEVV